jgi:hypothetical protein
MGVGWGVGLGAEAVKRGLVAGGWCWLVSVSCLAFGVCGWELLIVGVDGWLLVGWVRLVSVRFTVSCGGGGGVGVGR